MYKIWSKIITFLLELVTNTKIAKPNTSFFDLF